MADHPATDGEGTPTEREWLETVAADRLPDPEAHDGAEHVCGPSCQCGCAEGLTIRVRPISAAVSPAEPPEVAHKEPEPMDSRERTLHFWLARLVAYPRWVSIGSINSHAELSRVSAEDFAKIQEVLRGR